MYSIKLLNHFLITRNVRNHWIIIVEIKVIENEVQYNQMYIYLDHSKEIYE